MPVTRPLAPADGAAESYGLDSCGADSRGADSYVSGRLDVTTAADLRANLIDMLERRAAEPSGNGNDVVIDLSGVESVDMVGVGLLVGVHRQAQRLGRRLVLTGVPPRVMRLLTATRLRRILAVRDRPKAAPRNHTALRGEAARRSDGSRDGSRRGETRIAI